MKYFDSHVHLPSADRNGFDALLRHIEEERDLLGGLLILNTDAEIETIERFGGELPPSILTAPYFGCDAAKLSRSATSGWFKIHPTLQKISSSELPRLRETLVTSRTPPKGLIVHCFPWGKSLHFNVSLPLVMMCAETLPSTPVLATHGGGYESWAFRSHAGTFKNVIFDFSVTLSYYSGSDLLRPLQRYLQHSPDRVVFGTDWPSAQAGEQIAELRRLAAGVHLGDEALEALLLKNSQRYWPAAFGVNDAR